MTFTLTTTKKKKKEKERKWFLSLPRISVNRQKRVKEKPDTL